MKKALIFLLILVIIVLLVLVGMLWQRRSNCPQEPGRATMSKNTNKVTKLPLKAKGKNMLFSIKNKKDLVIRERIDSLHPYVIVDSFPLTSGVELGFTQERDSIVIKDPDIPANYYIVGMDINLLGAVPPTINTAANEVTLATSAGYNLSGSGTPIVCDDPAGLNKLFFRVRGTASGCGVGFSGPEPTPAYVNFDFEMGQTPGSPNDLYLQLDPTYNNLLLMGFPAKPNLVMSLNPIP